MVRILTIPSQAKIPRARSNKPDRLLAVPKFGQVTMILWQEQVSNSLSWVIRTVGTAFDWLIANLVVVSSEGWVTYHPFLITL